jgi:hypothetical protein
MCHVGQCKRRVLYHNVCLNYGIRFMCLIQSVLKEGISTAEWVPSSVSIQRQYPLYGSSFRVRWHNVAEKVLVLKVHLYKFSPVSHSRWRSVTRNGCQVEYYVASEVNRSHGRYRSQLPTAMTKEWEEKEFLDQWRFLNRLLLFANLSTLNFHTLPSIPFSRDT